MLKCFRFSVIILMVAFSISVLERQSFAGKDEKKGEVSGRNEICYGCERKSCSATLSTWKQLYEKYFLGGETKEKKKGEIK